MLYLLPAHASLPRQRTPLLNIIHCCDALTLLRGLSDGCVNLVVMSPPYNLRNTTGGGLPESGKWKNAALADGYDGHEDNMPHGEYVAWQRAILTECMRVLPDTGAIFYNHKWRVQEGLIQDRADIVAGFPVRQIIIWQRAGGINWSDRFFCPTYEVIYLIAKPDFKLQPGGNTYGDVWYIPQETDNPHPAPFPVEIPRRCIEAGCPAAGVVLDPFMGSGTTALAAKQTGRNYIGCDLSAKYVEQAKRRLAQPYTLSMFDRVEPAAKPEQLSFAGMSV